MEKAGAIWLIVYVITMNVCMGESMDIKTVYWNEVRGNDILHDCPNVWGMIAPEWCKTLIR
mgnify:CR=1 FL=1